MLSILLPYILASFSLFASMDRTCYNVGLQPGGTTSEEIQRFKGELGPRWQTKTMVILSF